jgi:hypothetical protein
MKTKLLLATLVCFGTVPVAHAQEITGMPGAPSATTTTGGNNLPLPDPAFGGEINKLTYKLGPQAVAPEPKAEMEPTPAPEPDPIDTAKR